MKNNAQVGIIMGSDSDLKVLAQAGEILGEFRVEPETYIASAHRTPENMYEYATSAKKRGIKVIIAGAGGSAHLPGMTASMTTLPVIGVPIRTKTLDGLDSLLSIVEMPPGIPVATVGINAAKNAGLLAIRILALSDPRLEKKLTAYRKKTKSEIGAKNKKLKKMGYKKYLKSK